MRSRLVLAGVIVIIYAAACCSPALHFDNYYPGQSAPQSSDTWFGWTALLLGWLGFFVGSVAWLANLSLAVAVFFLLVFCSPKAHRRTIHSFCC
jgi:hypothetical protein